MAKRQPCGSKGTYGNDAVTSAVSISPNYEEVERKRRERYQDDDDAPFGQHGASVDARVRTQRDRPEEHVHEGTSPFQSRTGFGAIVPR
jgi:hypothetical protein